MRSQVLAMGRHEETEAEGAGASQGTRFLFSSMTETLARRFTLLRVPSYFYRVDPRTALRVAIDILREADFCLFGLPPNPSDLDPFFLVREQLQRQTPFVYMPLGEFPRGAWWYRHLHRRFGLRDLILFSSQADKAVYDRLVAVAPARAAVIPFGIRTRQFRPQHDLRRKTRQQLGLKEEEVVLVYHGRITAEKNVHAVLSLGRRLARDRPQMRLWIIGTLPTDSPMAALIRHLVRDPALASRTTFWGNLAPAALPRMLAAADIAITLTLNGDENFGYSTVEAMACGLPAIGTDWGGLKDTIDDGVTGFRVPTVITASGVAFDHFSAWRSVLALLDNRELRLSMGAAARERAARHFELSGFADALATKIKGLDATEGAAPPPHVWTELGQRLTKTFAADSKANPAYPLALRVPAGPMLMRDHPLMREVVEPYASPGRESKRDDLLMLATEFLRLDSTGLRSTDPRYVFERRVVTAAERAVIAYLRRRRAADLSGIERCAAGSFERAALGRAVEALTHAGIIIAAAKSKNAVAVAIR